jgi:hypothetical protein
LPVNPAATRPLELQYAVGPNELDGLADWLSFRTLRARWTTADGDTVGWAQLSLLGCSQSDIDAPDEDLTYAVVAGGSPAAGDLASLLATTCGHPLAEVFVFGRHVARLDVLELRQDLCGRGLGAPLCNHLLDIVQREFAIVLFVLMPRPLGLDEGACGSEAGDCGASRRRRRLSAKPRPDRPLLHRQARHHDAAWKPGTPRAAGIHSTGPARRRSSLLVAAAR